MAGERPRQGQSLSIVFEQGVEGRAPQIVLHPTPDRGLGTGRHLAPRSCWMKTAAVGRLPS